MAAPMRSPAAESIAAASPDTSVAEIAPRPTYSTMLDPASPSGVASATFDAGGRSDIRCPGS